MSSLSDYFQPARGTIAGFDGIDLPRSPTRKRVSFWSIEQIRQFLLNESGTNFPTAERLDQVEQLIIDHINDRDNPHEVSVTAITDDVSRQLVNGFIPGTPPKTTPVLAYDSEAGVAMDGTYPAQYTTTNFYSMNRGGIFIDPVDDSSVIGSDCSAGSPGLPLYSNVTNLVSANWPTSAGLKVNTRLTLIDNDIVRYPFDFYRVDETNAAGEFGVAIPVNLTVSKSYTATIFVQMLAEQSYIVLRQNGSSTGFMVVNGETGEFVMGNNSVTGDVTVYPSGLMKISYSFLALASGPSKVNVLHRYSQDPEINRIGSTGRVLFLLAHPTVTNGPIGAPVLVNPSIAGSTSSFEVDFDQITVPQTMSEFVLSVVFNFKKQLPALTILDTVLFQWDGLSLVRDTTTVYLKLNNTVIAQTPIKDGRNAFGVSYSGTTIKFKANSDAKVSVPGTYSPLTTAHFSIGPCSGHLSQFTIYPEEDTAQVLEFVTYG